ncbi:MAG: hypothetical protein WKG00_17400 [Polyangiaceae bacterium]
MHFRGRSISCGWALCSAAALFAATGCGPPFEACEGAACSEGEGEGAGAATSASAAAASGGLGGAGAAGGAAVGNGGLGGTSSISSSSSGSGGQSDPCAGVCAPVVPAGWDGPVAAFVGPGPAGDCGAAGEVVHGNAGDIHGDVACTPCSCGSPSGASCGLPTVTFYNNPNCVGESDTLQVNGSLTCKNIDVDLTDYVASVKYTSVPSAQGTCQPGGGALQAEPVTFDDEALLCNLPVVGECQGAETCVGAPPASFEQRVCIYQQGDHGCPAAYRHAFPIYTSFSDTRDCTSCACAKSTPTCGGTLGVYTSGSNCINSATTVAKGVCVNATPGSMRWTAGAFGAGTCAPSGGALQGGVIPEGPITVCCSDP